MPFLRSGLLILFLCTGFMLHAQPKKLKLEGTKCRLVSISDPGEFYSTYTFTDEDLQALHAAGLKHTLIDKISQHHTESTWPAKLGSLDERIEHPEILKAYVVYKVAEINNMVILVAPAKYNSTQPEGWALTEDVFFVLSKAGVNL